MSMIKEYFYEIEQERYYENLFKKVTYTIFDVEKLENLYAFRQDDYDLFLRDFEVIISDLHTGDYLTGILTEDMKKILSNDNVKLSKIRKNFFLIRRCNP